MPHPVVRAIGLDISERSTGCVVLQNQEEKAPGVPRPPMVCKAIAFQLKNVFGLERAAAQALALDEVLAEEHPTIAVVEDYAFVFRKTIQGAVEVGTCLRLKLRQHGIPIVFVAPRALKKFARDRGDGDKAAVARAVKKRWGFVDPCHDIIDAYVLARIGIGLKGVDPLSLTLSQTQVLTELTY